MTDNDLKPSLLMMKREISSQNKNLNKNEHIQMLKIIEESNSKLSKNQNGFFVNLNFLSPYTIEKLYKFIKYTIDCRKDIDMQHNKIMMERNKLSHDDYEICDEGDSDLHTFENTIKTDSLNMNSLVDDLFHMNVQSLRVMYDFTIDDNTDNDSSSGSKINLKKNKAKFSGHQAKLIKKYKNVNKMNKLNTVIIDDEQKMENATLFDIELSKSGTSIGTNNNTSFSEITEITESKMD